MKNDLWAAAYSPDQGCFDVETLPESLAIHCGQILSGCSAHYLIFGVYDPHDQDHGHDHRREHVIRATADFLRKRSKRADGGRFPRPKTSCRQASGQNRGSSRGNSDEQQTGDLRVGLFGAE